MELFCKFFFFVFIGIFYVYGIQNDDWNDWSGDECEAAIKETIFQDHTTVVDETSKRLHSTWLSQECEIRAGPEYIIRKYTFYEDGTFLLLRHHYAEESCSVATHTVTAKGVIRLLSTSGFVSGATDAKYHLDHVHILPLTRQVAHKFGQRVNFTCTKQSKWNPFVQQVIFEKTSRRNTNNLWDSLTKSSKKYTTIDCLDSLNINFDELQLVRVQKKPITSEFGLIKKGQIKIELYLGSLPANSQLRKSHRSTSLQPTSLIRSDMISGCFTCGIIMRGTESRPPLLHELVPLPALIGGFWISSSCESNEGGLWTKRQLRIYSGDILWSGRWDYYADSKCKNYRYTILSSGSYVQRAGQQNPHRRMINLSNDKTDNIYPNIEDRNNKNLDYNLKLNERNLHERKSLAKWMSPDLAKKLADTYNDKNNLYDKILPTVEDIEQADESISYEKSTSKVRRSLDLQDESYKHILQNTQPSMAESFAAILRGNQRQESSTVSPSMPTMTTTKKPQFLMIPSGTTELDLHVTESILTIGDLSIAARCGAQITGNEKHGLYAKPLKSWPKNCVKHSIQASSIINLRAKIDVNWNGEYNLVLGSKNDNIWQAPLQKCGNLPEHNPILKLHLKKSLGYRLFAISSGTTFYLSWNCIVILFSCLYLFR
ncbi:hypothetical protein HCN44_002545 [Aphidius gifuensis]|uniref:APCDD1 domain-containing protein n=1 Tax=Aphidius gifuensis TaxID=684658 RepID=A0A835CUC7_APHGI|nr:hypothetical protein HCN44_002545 [Aphidius gifuensis]